MSGAGRGVTPGAEPEAGQDESATPGEPEQARPSSADNGAETPDAKAPDQAQAETSSKAEASATGASSSGTSSQAQLQVSSMKHISETCSTKAKSDMGSHSDKSSDKPMSEKPPTPR